MWNIIQTGEAVLSIKDCAAVVIVGCLYTQTCVAITCIIKVASNAILSSSNMTYLNIVLA